MPDDVTAWWEGAFCRVPWKRGEMPLVVLPGMGGHATTMLSTLTWQGVARDLRGERERRLREALPVAYGALRKLVVDEWTIEEVVRGAEPFAMALTDEERAAVRVVEAALNAANGGA